MKSFIVSNKGIAFEDFDEEIVVVNLPVGYYYSMKGTARKLFLQAVNGTNQNNLAKYIVANYDLALTEALVSSAKVNSSFDFSILNIGGTNTATLVIGTGWTLVGVVTIAANISSSWRAVKTGDGAWSAYRLA